MSNYTIEERGDISIVHQGAKNFWKSRSNLDIIIAEHRNGPSAIYEVVCHDANTDIDERIYIDCIRLRKNISHGLIETTMAAKIEQYNRAKKSFSKQIIEKQVINELMIQYVLARIFLESCERKDNSKSESGLPESLAFSVAFRQPDSHVVTYIDPLCEKPSTVVPLQVIFPKKCT